MRKERIRIPYYENFLDAILFYPDDDDKRYPVVCKVHGLVSNDFQREEELAKKFTSQGMGYFVFHLSGFYNSSGVTSIQRSFENLDCVVTFLTHHPKINPFRIGLYGVSLGGAIVTCHASRDPRIATIALQTPLFDFSFMADYPEFDALWQGLALTGLIRLPEHGIRKDMLCDIRGNSPLKCINKISPRPVLIIAGGKDKFMPIDGIKRLFSNAYYPKNFTVINEADHNLSNETAKHEAFNIITKFFTKKLVEA